MTQYENVLLRFTLASSLGFAFVFAASVFSSEHAAPDKLKLNFSVEELRIGSDGNAQPENLLSQLEIQWKNNPVNHFCGTCSASDRGKRTLIKLILLKQCRRDDEFRELAMKLVGYVLGYDGQRATVEHRDFLMIFGRLHYQAGQIQEFEQLLNDMHQEERLQVSQYISKMIRENPNANLSYDESHFDRIDQEIECDSAYIRFLRQVEHAELKEIWEIANQKVDEKRRDSVYERNHSLLTSEAKSIFLANPEVAIPFLRKKLDGISPEQALAFEILSRLKDQELVEDIERSFQQIDANAKIQKDHAALRSLSWQLFMALRRIDTLQAKACFARHKNDKYIYNEANYVESNAHVVIARESSPVYRFSSP